MKRKRSYSTATSSQETVECFFNDYTHENDIDLKIKPCKSDKSRMCCQSDANGCYVTSQHEMHDPCHPICWNSTMEFKEPDSYRHGKPYISGGCLLKAYNPEVVCESGSFTKCCTGEKCNDISFMEKFIAKDLEFTGRSCAASHQDQYPGVEITGKFEQGRFILYNDETNEKVYTGPTCAEMNKLGLDSKGNYVDTGWLKPETAMIPGFIILLLLLGIVSILYRKHKKKFKICYGYSSGERVNSGDVGGEAMLPIDDVNFENDSTPTNISENENNQHSSDKNKINGENNKNQHNQTQINNINMHNQQQQHNNHHTQHKNNLDISEGTTQVTDLSYLNSTAPLLNRGPPNIDLEINNTSHQIPDKNTNNSPEMFHLVQHQIKRDLDKNLTTTNIQHISNDLSLENNSIISAAPPTAGIRPEDLFSNQRGGDIADFENSILTSICPSTGRGPAELELRKVTMNIKRGEIIGQGRFGRVYKAVDNVNRELAVKVIYSKDEQQYQIEATIMKYGLLNHPNIVNFFMADRVDTGAFTELWLVTEYYRNNSLYDYRKILKNKQSIQKTYFSFQFFTNFLYLNRERTTKQNLTDEQVGFFAQSVATGLAFLHSEEHLSDMSRPKIAHRDLKSKNILIKDDQQSCVIADFGLAVSYSSKTQKLLGVENGKIAGTVRYLAPEIIFDESIDCSDFSTYERADMYCLSLVFWEILTCSGEQGDYKLPYDEYTSRDPTIDDMRNALASTGILGDDIVPAGAAGCGSRIGIKCGINRPSVDDKWRDNFEELVECMEECWNAIPAARPTSLNVMKNINRFIERKKFTKK